MSKELSFVRDDLESAVILLDNLRGLLGMLRYSGQTPSEVKGDDLEGAVESINYIIGDVEENIRSVISKVMHWQPAEIRKGA